MRALVCASLLLSACNSSPISASATSDAASDGCDPYAASNQPNAPCGVDSDCHDGFLVCVRSSVDACRDGTDAAVAPDAGSCAPAWRASLPICPTTAHVAVGLCKARYQLPCVTAGDCGPTGYMCASSRCVETGTTSCATAGDCPSGWACAAPCACGDATAKKSCIPPFAVFSCPECQSTPSGG
jgi:hypothetical protein